MDTVQQMLHARADDGGTGLLSGSRRWSWREVVDGAVQRAHVLARMRGDGHVGVLLENTPEMVLAILAGAAGNHPTAGINATRRGAGLLADIRTADVTVLLTDAEHLPLLDGLDLDGVTVVDTDGGDWAAQVAVASSDRTDLPTAAAVDTFMLIFTSGTSGDPKAVQVGNFMVALSGVTLSDKFALGPADVCYNAMPLFHSNAIMGGLAPALAAGAAIALAPRFTASRFLDDVRHYGATYMNYVGKPLAYVLATEPRDDDADNPLRAAFGNEATDRDIKEFAQRFGCQVWDGFGSTETAVIILRDQDTPLGSIGQPWPGVAVYDRLTRTECPRAVIDEVGRVVNLDDAVGELVNTEGAGYFGGYYNDPRATAERLDGGMYWSGDLAYRDDAGNVYLAGRTADWLRVDGENIAAAPVEQVLLRHDALSLAAVYAVPDAHVGDQLMVALVLKDGATLTPGDLEAFLAAQADLSPKAWPRYVRIAGSLPSTATNKVLKRELVAQGVGGIGDDTLWEREERGRAYHPA